MSGKNSLLLENYFFLLKAREQIRSWLTSRGYLEVLVPTLSPEATPELNLEAFSTQFFSAFDDFQSELFLQTSPELLMKRLLAEGLEKIFYLGPAYRQGEYSPFHHPEFTIVEWYASDKGYWELMDELEQMLGDIFELKSPIPREPFARLVEKEAGADLMAFSHSELILWLKEKGRGDFSQTPQEQIYDFIIVQFLEPAIKKFPSVFVFDFPSQLTPQAKIHPENPRFSQRFELYLKGIEVANGYCEETAPEEIKIRFIREQEKRKREGKKIIPLPKRFLESLKKISRDYSGLALGLERLVMAVLGLNSLDELLPFREISIENKGSGS